MTQKDRKAGTATAESQPSSDKASLTVSRKELLVDGSDAAFRDLLHDFFAFAAQMERVRAMFGEYIGLSATQYMALIAVSRMEGAGDLGINQLAEHLHLSGAFVTIEVNKLVKIGYIIKHPHPTDGRRIVMEVTQRGTDALARLAEFQRPVNDALFASLDTQQFRQLATLLTHLADDGVKALRLAEYAREVKNRNRERLPS